MIHNTSFIKDLSRKSRDTLLQSGITDFWIVFLLLMDNLKVMTFIDYVFITEQDLAKESLLARHVL